MAVWPPPPLLRLRFGLSSTESFGAYTVIWKQLQLFLWKKIYEAFEAWPQTREPRILKAKLTEDVLTSNDCWYSCITGIITSWLYRKYLFFLRCSLNLCFKTLTFSGTSPPLNRFAYNKSLIALWLLRSLAFTVCRWCRQW